jgi:hypothetical protein
VDAILEGNSTISALDFGNNSITAIGLSHVTRLLQHQHPSSAVVSIRLDENFGMFDNQETTRLFLIALQNSKMKYLSFKYCRLPSQAVIALFQAAAMLETLRDLHVYDNVRLEGQDLMRLLQVIPNMSNVCHLCINLAFRNEAVSGAFHLNTSIRRLCGDFHQPEIMPGTVLFEILKRNRRLLKARRLLCLFRMTTKTTTTTTTTRVPAWDGLWAKAIEELTLDSSGATAIYEIMQEKLVEWCAPTATLPVVASGENNNTAAAVSGAFCGCIRYSFGLSWIE